MLGVFLLSAFTRLEHECQNLLSQNTRVLRLDLGLYFHPKEFLENGIRTHVNSKGKIPSTGNILPRGGSNPQRCMKQNSEPNTLPRSSSGPFVDSNPKFKPSKTCVIRATLTAVKPLVLSGYILEL